MNISYKFYKIRGGKIHIFPKQESPEKYNYERFPAYDFYKEDYDRYFCGLRVSRWDIEQGYLNSDSLYGYRHRICKRCFAKFIKENQIVVDLLPDKLFEI